MQVLQYLLDDVSEFLKSYNFDVNANDNATEEKGCVNVLKEFIDFISERETENFRVRRHDNNHAVTLTTIHQVYYLPLQSSAVFLSKLIMDHDPGLVYNLEFIVNEFLCICFLILSF